MLVTAACTFPGEQISAQRITNLHRHLTALLTNIQTAADARESMRRKDLEEAREMRSVHKYRH